VFTALLFAATKLALNRCHVDVAVKTEPLAIEFVRKNVKVVAPLTALTHAEIRYVFPARRVVGTYGPAEYETPLPKVIREALNVPSGAALELEVPVQLDRFQVLCMFVEFGKRFPVNPNPLRPVPVVSEVTNMVGT
jgi:hypothetical protein